MYRLSCGLLALLLLGYSSCERIPEHKVDTKVDLEVDYSHGGPVRTIKFSHIIPNSPKALNSVGSRPVGSNNNLRHVFRFSTSDKGTGTLSASDNEGNDGGNRVRNQFEVGGSLVHVVSRSDGGNQGDISSHGNSSTIPLTHTACNDVLNVVKVRWVALVQNGPCLPDKIILYLTKLRPPPAAVLIYGSPTFPDKQDYFLSSSQEETPMVIYLPRSVIQGVVDNCLNSSGEIVLPPEQLGRANRSQPDWPLTSRNQCNATLKVSLISEENYLNKTSVLFVSISFILLMVISLAWLMFYYVQRFRYIHTKEQFSRRLAHMAKKAVAKIPVKILKQGDKETDAEVDHCAICIECYKPSDTVRILPCKHYFHRSCIDPWLLEQRSCPMCKLNILHAYGFMPNERGSLISEDRLSELDSSLELQFLPGPVIPPLPESGVHIQTHGPGKGGSDPPARGQWASFRLKRALYATTLLDRSVSLRHLATEGGSLEECATFLPRTRPLSRSAAIPGRPDPASPPSDLGAGGPPC